MHTSKNSFSVSEDGVDVVVAEALMVLGLLGCDMHCNFLNEDFAFTEYSQSTVVTVLLAIAVDKWL